MAELRAFYVNPSKIPDEPLEVVFCIPLCDTHYPKLKLNMAQYLPCISSLMTLGTMESFLALLA